MNDSARPPLPRLRATRMRLHTQDQPIVVMRRDCHVCHAEGLASRSQVLVIAGERKVQALLYQTDNELFGIDQIALSEAAWTALDIDDDDTVQVKHAPLIASLAAVRGRIHGQRLGEQELVAIIKDIVAGSYTEVHLAAFLTATAALPLDEEETVHLTRAMVGADQVSPTPGRSPGPIFQRRRGLSRSVTSRA